MPPSDRLPRVQELASYCRLVQGAQAAGGQRLGTSGNTMGNAHLTGALSEAATRFLRGNEPGQKSLARLENKQDKGHALSLCAHQRARAVSCMLTRHTAFELEQCLWTAGSRARDPGAARDPAGMSLPPTAMQPTMAASSNAAGRLGPLARRPALCLDTRAGSYSSGDCPHPGNVYCPSPEPAPPWRAAETQPAFGGGR
jgi:hypothetical protein